MTVVAWIVVGVALWLAVAAALALLLGRAVRMRDEQVPRSTTTAVRAPMMRHDRAFPEPRVRDARS